MRRSNWIASILAAGLLVCSPIGGAGVVELSDLGHRVEEFDFHVAEDGTIDLVWISSTSSPTTSYLEWALWYRRSGPNGSDWTPPRNFGVDGISPFMRPRILVHDGRIHIVVGNRLRHFVSGDGGSTWSDLGPLLVERQYARAFDVAPSTRGLILACLASPRGGGRTDPLLVLTARVGAMGLMDHQTLGTIDRAMGHQQEVRLTTQGEKLYLAYGVTLSSSRQSTTNGQTSTVSGSECVSFLTTSPDQGIHWGVPAVIRTPRQATIPEGQELCRGFDVLRTLAGITIVPDPTCFLRQLRDGSWEVVPRLSRPDRFWVGPAQFSSPTIGAVGTSTGQLFWIDSRHQRSDRAWYNPLGGFPWGDNPDWGNTDVFSIPLSGFLAAGKAPKPTRWTRGLAYASGVLARPAGDRVWVIWAACENLRGRSDIGRAPMSFFVTSLPPQ